MNFEETLRAELGLDPQDGVGPGDRVGTWTSVASHFGAHGYIRILIREHEGLFAWLEIASPKFDRGFIESLAVALTDHTSVEFRFEEQMDAWHGSVALPEDKDALILLFAQVLKVTDLMNRMEEGEDGVKVLSDLFPSDSNRSEDQGAVFESIGDDPAQNPEDGPGADPADNESPFEPIGSGLPNLETKFDIATAGQELTATFYFGDRDNVLATGIYDALRRNIRAKFDATVSRETPDADDRVVLLIAPDDSLGAPPKLGDLELQIGEYLQSIVELKSSVGIDPAVFLGVRTSKKIPKRPRTPEGDAPSVVLVADESDDNQSDEVVFGAPTPDQDDGLQAGRFDDPRLDQVDSEAGLVDVVLRHPGYSDRSVGQVLTILLSIEYHQALRLMNEAPCVVARAVALQRAQTMKRVIEGAGGRVLLTDPEQFVPA